MSSPLPPHNETAERALLGSALIDPDVLLQLDIKPDDFYRADYGATWAAMLDLVAAQKSVDIITVPEVLQKRGVTLPTAELIGLLAEVPTSINAPDYADVVRANAQRRALINLAARMTTAAYNDAGSVETIISDAETALIAVRQGEERGWLTTAQQNAGQFLDDLQAEETSTIPTYYLDLDRAIGGLEPGAVYWFCAAEKMGKTSFVSHISLRNALAGRVVLRFSLEMSARQRTRRDIAMMTGLSIEQLKRRELTSAQMSQAMAAAGRLSEAPLRIDETPGITPSKMRASLNRVLMDYGRIDLIELDYFQLGEVDKPTANRVSDLETYSRNIAQIAREYAVPIVGTAQVLSKSIEQRSDKRPYLSDVFGSSALAKDGYLIAFLYRDEYYNPDTTEMPNTAELIIRAHRDGSPGVIMLNFHPATSSFRNAAH